MACLFLEHCGRFLLRSPDSHLRAKALLEILLRKKKVQHLDGRQRSLVENALYYANPPEVSQISVVQQPPMQRYIKKLIYKDLNKMNTEKVIAEKDSESVSVIQRVPLYLLKIKLAFALESLSTFIFH